MSAANTPAVLTSAPIFMAESGLLVTASITVTCPSSMVPAADTLTCTYEADLPDGTTRTNTATATQQNYDFARRNGNGEVS